MATAQHRAKKSKKNRKHGRQSVYCLHYKNSHRREQNKLVNLKKHLARFPDDATAKAAVIVCRVALGHKL